MANDDREGISLLRLAELYVQDGRRDAAAKCYETMLRRKDRDVSARVEGSVYDHLWYFVPIVSIPVNTGVAMVVAMYFLFV